MASAAAVAWYTLLVGASCPRPGVAAPFGERLLQEVLSLWCINGAKKPHQKTPPHTDPGCGGKRSLVPWLASPSSRPLGDVFLGRRCRRSSPAHRKGGVEREQTEGKLLFAQPRDGRRAEMNPIFEALFCSS